MVHVKARRIGPVVVRVALDTHEWGLGVTGSYYDYCGLYLMVRLGPAIIYLYRAEY